MGIKEWIIPQERKFFEYLEKQSKIVLEGAIALEDMLKNYTDIEAKDEKIRDIEHRGDKVVHFIYEELNKIFITPLDREDIAKLASSLDDILDLMEDVATRLLIYKIKEPQKCLIELAEVLHHSVKELDIAIGELKDMHKSEEIENKCIEVNKLENDADKIARNAISRLYEEKDAIYIMKMKEIIDFLEEATDKCEDAANVISDVIVKYG